MICKVCGTENEDNLEFCAVCGSALNEEAAEAVEAAEVAEAPYKDTLGIVSLVCGIVGLVCPCLWVGSIVAIILGVMSKKKAAEAGATTKGKVGMILGIVALVLGCIGGCLGGIFGFIGGAAGGGMMY